MHKTLIATQTVGTEAQAQVKAEAQEAAGAQTTLTTGQEFMEAQQVHKMFKEQ